jgi:hypothetical protein
VSETDLCKFFPLTQVCQQIRKEYRPLRLRDSTLRLVFEDLPGWFDTFYPTTTDLQNYPKVLQISWRPEIDNAEGHILDITPLIQLSAHCDLSLMEFIDHQKLCYACESKTMSWDDSVVATVNCNCRKNVYDTDYRIYLLDQAGHTDELQDFIMNENEAWKEDILEFKPQIRCTRNREKRRYEFEICFGGEASEILLHKNPRKGAWRYLKTRGIMGPRGIYKGMPMELGVKLLYQSDKVVKPKGYFIQEPVVA